LETTYAPTGELRDIRKTQNEGFGKHKMKDLEY